MRISQYLAEALGQICTMNIWTGDGFGGTFPLTASGRMRYKESIDEILSEPFDFTKGQALHRKQGFRHRRGELYRRQRGICPELRRHEQG